MNVVMDFVVIGAHKSGTTTLTDSLASHPDIFMPAVKETRFFTARWSVGPKFLTPFYRDRKNESLLGGADVHLLFFPQAPERIKEHNPRIKLICVLRNPVDRAYSAYWYARKNGWESSATFEEALDRENDRARGNYTERADLTYLGHGLYHEQLERFLEVFERSQLLVLLMEELQREGRESIKRVLDWLGAASEPQYTVAAGRSNPAGRARFPALHARLMARDTVLRRAARRLIPAGMRHLLEQQVVERLARLNSAPFEYPPMNSETLARLREYFRPHNERLAMFLGRDLTGWG